MKLILFILCQYSLVQAVSFDEAIKLIESHDQVESIKYRAKMIKAQGEVNSSWGDPMLKIAASNFPVDSLTDDETPMTGIEFGISQTIPLTTKYGNIEHSYNKLSDVEKFNALSVERQLKSELWKIAITKKKIIEETKIFKENASWLKNNIKTSKRLYSNGKISQEALLDLEIRKSEVDAQISNKIFDLKEIESNLIFLIGREDTLDISKTPWHLLKKKTNENVDPTQQALESKLKSSEFLVRASKLNYVPDITIGASYRKRQDLDNNGDFVSASVSFPLPFSDKRYASNNSAVNDKYSAHKLLKNYKVKKSSTLRKIDFSISKIRAELEIINSKTIRYAENSRKVTSKAYALGEGTYVGLLQSELKLQNLMLRREEMKEKIALLRLENKLIRGEKLND
jgi:outer membrane protein TolC